MRRYNLPGDRALLKNLLAEIPPVSLIYGGRHVTLAELSPQIEREALDGTRGYNGVMSHQRRGGCE